MEYSKKKIIWIDAAIIYRMSCGWKLCQGYLLSLFYVVNVFKSHGVVSSTLSFMTKHLKNSIDRPSLFIYCSDFIKDKNSFLTICNENERDGDTECMDTIIEDFDLSSFRRRYHITFTPVHCNGIICMTVFPENDILVCNPALREFKFITGSCFGPWKRDQHKQMVGFGHDSIDNVYKVVRVVCEYGEPIGAEIHTLSIDHHNSWRMINIEAHICTGCISTSMYQALQCKRIIYWLASGCCSGKPVILSFDAHDEKFETISLPALDDNFSTRETCLDIKYKLALWNESVVLFKFYIPRCRCGKRSSCNCLPKPIEMWVMHESFMGPDKSYFWTKHLTIPLIEQFYRPVVFILMNLSLSNDPSRKVCLASSYNLDTQKFRNLHGIPETLRGIGSFAYVQSLVSIN